MNASNAQNTAGPTQAGWFDDHWLCHERAIGHGCRTSLALIRRRPVALMKSGRSGYSTSNCFAGRIVATSTADILRLDYGLAHQPDR